MLSSNIFDSLLSFKQKSNILTTPENPLFHFLIEDENLSFLHSVQKSLNEKIDVIYIDPPYNTGKKSFIYHDKRQEDWHYFMKERLSLAKTLLKTNGIVFISIDQHEISSLKILCDDIFERENFISIISVVNNFSGRNDNQFIATANEFLLIYAKDISQTKLNGFSLTEKQKEEFHLADEFGEYKAVLLRKTGKNSKKEDRPNLFYPIYYHPKMNKLSLDKEDGMVEILPIDSKGREGTWRWEKKRLLSEIDKNVFVKRNRKGNYCLYSKMRKNINGEERKRKAKSFWLDVKYESRHGTALLKDMFGENVFTNPKPLEFIKDILKISTNKDSVILDFFAGSGTTAHAVLELNHFDGGNRQVILCTNNENNICENVTYPRIEKVINGYKTTKNKVIKGCGGNLLYYQKKKAD